MTASTPTERRHAVDPRFRQRRAAVQKRAARRRLQRLAGLVAVAVVALVAAVTVRSPILDVDRIEVVGSGRTSVEAVVGASGITIGDPSLLVDLGDAAEGIEALPWVESVNVDRSLPATVSIAVVERVPAAVVTGGGRSVVVDVSGRVLGDRSEVETLVLVEVVDDIAPPPAGETVRSELLAALDVASRLAVNPAGAVSRVLVGDGIELVLAQGGVADLGEPVELDAKIEAFRTMFARVDRTCLAVMDLRVPSRAVLTRHPGCS